MATKLIDSKGELSASRKKITDTDRGTVTHEGTTAIIVLVGVDEAMSERAAKILARHTRRNVDHEE